MHAYLAFVGCALTLLGCESTGLYGASPLRFEFPTIEVSGPYARTIKAEDIRALRLIATRRPDTDLPIWTIEAIAPDRVEVETKESRRVGDHTDRYRYEARKRDGVWAVDTSTIKKETATYAPYEGEPVLTRAADPY